MPVYSLLKCGLSRFASCESGALASSALKAFVCGLGLAAALPFLLFEDIEAGDQFSVVMIDEMQTNLAASKGPQRTLFAALDVDQGTEFTVR